MTPNTQRPSKGISWRLPSALALALIGGILSGPIVQASGYGGIVTWLLFVVFLAIVVSIISDRWHYFVSGLAAVSVVTSMEIAGLVSHSKYGGDAGAYFRLNLPILAIMLVISLCAAIVTTLLMMKWRTA